MKKRTLTVLVVVLVCTFLTACSKEIDTVTESVNEKESNVIKNPTVLEDTIEIVFPEQFAKWYRKSDVSIRDLDEIFY